MIIDNEGEINGREEKESIDIKKKKKTYKIIWILGYAKRIFLDCFILYILQISKLKNIY